LEIDVDHVVVRDCNAPERVGDSEGPRLIARVEVPDDPYPIPAPYDAERPRRAGSELGVGALGIRDASLGYGGQDEALAFSKGNVPVAEMEVAREGDLDPLADPESAVRLDVDGDVGGEEREAVSSRSTREGKRGARDGSQR